MQEVILGNILAGTTGTLIRNDGSNQLVVVNGNIQAGEYGLLMMHGVDNLGNETTGGSGTTLLLINGDVTTSNPAAEAVKLRAGLGTTDMDVTIADDVNGDFGAVYIENRGSGSTLGEFTGHLQSQNGDALKVISGAQGTSLDIEVANTTGGNYGVSLTNNGTGPTSLTVLSGGVVQGSVAGISTSHTSAAPFTITINGEVRNISGLASDLAIEAISIGSGLTLQNSSNTIIGAVNLTDADDTFNNVGSWFTENGTSNFGGGNDQFNNLGLIRAANNPSYIELAFFNNLEQFNNSGIITLADGAVGDMLTTSGNYSGNGGTLLLDTVLGGDDPTTDRLVIEGDASGTTGILINPIGGTQGLTTTGIRVVDVRGISTNNAFSLANSSPLESGAFVYDLNFGTCDGTVNNSWYLCNTEQIGSIDTTYENATLVYLGTFTSFATLEQRVSQRQ